MTGLFFDRQPLNSIDDAYELYRDSEFESPTRSTVPLLSWLKHEQAAVNEVLQVLKVPAEWTGHLEYTVGSPRGEGPPSHTDLMVLSSGAALSVECKWTEPAGKTVHNWYPTVNPINGPLVLDGWLELLQRLSNETLARASFRQVINQMIHRAASACHAGTNPQLAYLLFSPSPDIQTASRQSIRDELAHLWRVLGRPAGFGFFLIQVELEHRDRFQQIVGLPKANPQTARQVIAALSSSEPLFNFRKPVIERIGAD